MTRIDPMTQMTVSEMKENPPSGYRVYKYTFPNGKIYIGQTKRHIYVRFLDKYKNKELMDAIKKYGWNNINVNILKENLNQEDALSEEIRFIALYDACNPSVGYNKSKGGYLGMLGMKHSEETKKKMSKSGKGKHSGILNPNYGVPKTEEQKEKIRRAKQKSMKPVNQYSRSGKFLKRYESVSSVARSMNTTTKNIRCCLKGVSHHACGYVWRYAEEVLQ